mgnify:CR=1 FL=1
MPFLTYEMLQEMETKISTSAEERVRISCILTGLDNLITLHQRERMMSDKIVFQLKLERERITRSTSWFSSSWIICR